MYVRSAEEQAVIDELVLEQAKREGSCVCLYFAQVPLLPAHPRARLHLEPDSRCPFHGGSVVKA